MSVKNISITLLLLTVFFSWSYNFAQEILPDSVPDSLIYNGKVLKKYFILPYQDYNIVFFLEDSLAQSELQSSAFLLKKDTITLFAKFKSNPFWALISLKNNQSEKVMLKHIRNEKFISDIHNDAVEDLIVCDLEEYAMAPGRNLYYIFSLGDEFHKMPDLDAGLSAIQLSDLNKDKSYELIFRDYCMLDWYETAFAYKAPRVILTYQKSIKIYKTDKKLMSEKLKTRDIKVKAITAKNKLDSLLASNLDWVSQNLKSDMKTQRWQFLSPTYLQCDFLSQVLELIYSNNKALAQRFVHWAWSEKIASYESLFWEDLDKRLMDCPYSPK